MKLTAAVALSEDRAEDSLAKESPSCSANLNNMSLVRTIFDSISLPTRGRTRKAPAARQMSLPDLEGVAKDG